MRHLRKLFTTFCLCASATAISLAASGNANAADTNKPISIATIDSSDADFIAYVYGGILEKLGYNTKYVRVDYTALIPAVETSDVDVATSIWDTTTWPAVVSAVNGGTAVNYGSTGVAVKEGWWYPKSMEKICPGLPDYKALNSKACVAALATAETAPKGRYIDAPADWETDASKRIKALGLNYESINSGSIVAMIATVRAAVQRKEPVVSWGYVPHWFFDKTPGAFVKLPPVTDACLKDPAAGPNPKETYDCGFSVGFVWKVASKGFSKKSPEAARILHLLHMTRSDVAVATGKIENDGQDVAAVAGEWIAAHEKLWRSWPIK